MGDADEKVRMPMKQDKKMEKQREIVESGVPFLFLVPTDSSRVITQRALKFVEKWKGTAIVLDYADFAMGLHDDLAPFVMFVPLEWFCYYFSIVRDHNPDDRRYYGVVEY